MATTIWPTIADAIANASHTAVAPLTWDPTTHLLSRFSFGPTVQTRKYVDQNGPDAWYTQQVGYCHSYSGYKGNSDVAAQGPLLPKSPYEVRQWLISQGHEYTFDAMDQLSRVTLGLQAWSSAQLYETLVDFFGNHLNVQNHDGDLWITRAAFDRQVIRKYAAKDFTSMLLASAKHPAMLQYLNLAESTKLAVNENYGRELLELHTVGLNYTENDVKNCAKLLTGRTIDQNQHYVYDDYIHPTGTVRVLGFMHPNRSAKHGEKAGDELIKFLAGHKDTARHLAQKLCVRFVSDNPSAALVAAVAQAYLDNKTQILPMVSTILRSTEFWESRGQKVRRPTENLMATIRVLGASPTDLSQALPELQWLTQTMGHSPLDWPAPNGYPDVAAAWRSSGTLLNLWSYQLNFAGGWSTCLSKPDIPTMWGADAKTSGEALAGLTKRLTGSTWSADDLAVLQTWTGEPASTPIAKSVLQWQGFPLVSIILHSPHHAFR